ncbi:ABC transporter substrate-binding protein [Pendulispora albinea]|uniref:ABC transporter substrate-binding protein n=2 Tax=Pendulispora albinea TaxID=2741071 RepID=A0ABZ2LXY5_9BACT
MAIPYSFAIHDYFRELNESGGIRGCPIDYDLRDDAYDVTKAQAIWDLWKAAPDWDEVVQVMTWGDDATLNLSPQATQEGKPLVSGSHAGLLASPRPIDVIVDVPDVGANFQEALLPQQFKSPGFPNNFFASTDDSTSARGAVFHVRQNQAKRLGFFYCNTAAFCRRPSPAAHAYAREIGLPIGRDLFLEPNEDEASYREKIRYYFRGEIDYKKSHPDYDMVDWVWVGSSPRAMALIAKAVASVQQELRASMPNPIQLIANERAFDEGLYARCGAACVGNVHGALPSLAFGDMSYPSREMPKVVALYDKWRTIDGSGSRAVFADGVSLDARTVNYVKGYVSALVFRMAVERVLDAGKTVTAQNVKEAYESFASVGTGGLTENLAFRPEDHRPQGTVYVYKFSPAGELLSEPPPRLTKLDRSWLGW